MYIIIFNHFAAAKVMGRLLLLISLARSVISCSKKEEIIPTIDVGMPKLLIPLADATMDNGCLDKLDPIQWYFSWGKVQGADLYHLYVKNQNALYPVIDFQLSDIQYTSTTYGYIIQQNAQDWKWKVRCRINGKWSDWSSERTFQVEPMQTDCPG
ncbi:MAG TPA: hypothetical protein PLR06_06235 [Cyclobacteriaceae bacterium]|nr:hypothetical protein [Cyclobacteriaceae bacterium]